jgi:hypothetical protein
MIVFLALYIDIHNCDIKNYVLLNKLKNFKNIKEEYKKNGSLLVMLGSGNHKIKRKAEMEACRKALIILDNNEDL